jgi:hypothetical protein
MNSISLPNQPTRPISEDMSGHVYLTPQMNAFALREGVVAVTPNSEVIAEIGGLVMAGLESRGLSTNLLARNMGTIVLRTYKTHPSFKNPLGWDVLLHKAPDDAPYYEYHPNRKLEPIRADRIIYNAQEARETHIHQITSKSPTTISAEDVATGFITGSYRLGPGGALEDPLSWKAVGSNAKDNVFTAGDRWIKVPQEAGATWVRQGGGEPFSITKRS